MADPLSVAAGVVGLVAGGANITKALTEVVKDAWTPRTDAVG